MILGLILWFLFALCAFFAYMDMKKFEKISKKTDAPKLEKDAVLDNLMVHIALAIVFFLMFLVVIV